MCSEKARFCHEALGLEGDFSASSGRLTRFKQRYGVRQITVEGEHLSADVTAADSFCVKFQEFIDEENLIPNQIYNADEAGLYWRCLPTKTIASPKERSAPGHISSKERITIMCSGNASGDHKMKLVMIGKAKKPFEGTESKTFNGCLLQSEGGMDDNEHFSLMIP
ncbi:Tigger transposable element-derived protein 2 [Araneus ventricosus]|uniref:Tigger transposable element-derived protein 2 n=1 Tax=Araneus ventricosus TaxID=182803 RepID=A0A4Y2GLZ7_ARAVE|nr:Tigger transposable element-derived protein 2 [Araneus ventricosus]